MILNNRDELYPSSRSGRVATFVPILQPRRRLLPRRRVAPFVLIFESGHLLPSSRFLNRDICTLRPDFWIGTSCTLRPDFWIGTFAPFVLIFESGRLHPSSRFLNRDELHPSSRFLNRDILVSFETSRMGEGLVALSALDWSSHLRRLQHTCFTVVGILLLILLRLQNLVIACAASYQQLSFW